MGCVTDSELIGGFVCHHCTGGHTLGQTIASSPVQLTCTWIRVFGHDGTTFLTIGVDFLYNLLYFCLSGVQVECTQYISDLVRVNFSISTFVKQGKCIPVFCVCVCVCVCGWGGEDKSTSLHHYIFYTTAACSNRFESDLVHVLLEVNTPPLNKGGSYHFLCSGMRSISTYSLPNVCFFLSAMFFGSPTKRKLPVVKFTLDQLTVSYC